VWSCGFYNNVDTAQPQKQEWNNPIKWTKLEAKQFATLSGLCDTTRVQYGATPKTMSVDPVRAPPEGANVIHNVRTWKGRQKLSRCVKRYLQALTDALLPLTKITPQNQFANAAFQVLVTIADAKLERHNV
jgi:hypothetical protein